MNTRKGFTLVELLVVIAILAILATVSVVGYTSFIERAEKSNIETEAHQVETIIESALIGKDYVVVTDADGEEVYITAAGVVASEPTEGTSENLTTDIGDLADNLEVKTDGLYYGHVKVAPIAPAADDEAEG